MEFRFTGEEIQKTENKKNEDKGTRDFLATKPSDLNLFGDGGTLG